MQYPNRAVAFTVEMQPHTLSINYIVKMNNWSILQTNIINFVPECYLDSNIPYYIQWMQSGGNVADDMQYSNQTVVFTVEMKTP